MEKFSKNDHHVTTGMYNKEKLVKYSDLTYGDEYKMKKKQTFIIEVVDTQDSTWQGRVSWVNGQKQQTFRSVVELLRLVDSVVGENEKGFIERKTF